ncbi:hypothetical protein BD310DRAFT_920045 [Dichomitus squalens]|uniref:Uncharacterized protein n=1 Tax=Dichomitus squalens TaxID=114155 RepID=A0A4Q9Q3L0_9APHY|nr:hypothetical protein BD310DRAFT_920045 [Dichomitus squalens]
MTCTGRPPSTPSSPPPLQPLPFTSRCPSRCLSLKITSTMPLLQHRNIRTCPTIFQTPQQVFLPHLQSIPVRQHRPSPLTRPRSRAASVQTEVFRVDESACTSGFRVMESSRSMAPSRSLMATLHQPLISLTLKGPVPIHLYRILYFSFLTRHSRPCRVRTPTTSAWMANPGPNGRCSLRTSPARRLGLPHPLHRTLVPLRPP